MDKAELAQYLVNLHTLIQAQTSSVHNASAMLAAEYESVWAQLKTEIKNDRERRESESD